MKTTYETLSPEDRLNARRVAQWLLETVPEDEPIQAVTADAALSTSYLKPANLLAVLFTRDADSHVIGKLVFKKAGQLKEQEAFTEFGLPTNDLDEALDSVKLSVSMIKSFEEHPILDYYRKIGIDPERLESFEIRYTAKARKWLLLEQSEIQAASSLFENFYAVNESRILAANNGKEVSIPFFARDEILDLAPRYAGDSDFLSFDHLSSGTSEREVKLLHLAASHLFANGVSWIIRLQENEPSCAVPDIATRDDFVLPDWKPMAISCQLNQIDDTEFADGKLLRRSTEISSHDITAVRP